MTQDTATVPPITALMEVLNFTSDDLKANQQGNLSPSQADRLKRNRLRTTFIGVAAFFVIVVIATIFLYFGQVNQSTILSIIGALLTVINAIMIGMIARAHLQTNADLREGGVEILEGELERVVRRGQQQDNYLLRIDGASLYVTKEIFTQFRHETSYRIYRSRWSGVILSAEPLV